MKTVEKKLVTKINQYFTRDEALAFYRQMFALRAFDDRCLQLKLKDLIMNGFHPYAGEEAVATGVCVGLRKDDVVISTHRPQGHSLCKGSTPRSVYAEMLGRKGGVSDGLGGPMQWIDKDNNFYCGSIVGSGVTIATGAGLAHQAFPVHFRQSRNRGGRVEVLCRRGPVHKRPHSSGVFRLRRRGAYLRLAGRSVARRPGGTQAPCQPHFWNGRWTGLGSVRLLLAV